jgi:hypothetical protein
MSDFITLKNLAAELGIDKSNLRKYILEKIAEVQLVKIRTPETHRQLVSALSLEDAEIVRQFRAKLGFAANKTFAIEDGQGVFYVIQLIPELDPNRIKLGFANSIEPRLQAHRTAAPTAKLIKVWSCKRTWEIAAMDSATRIECQLIANEVFTCDNLDNLVNRINSFFEQLPIL